jgi:hypothetical protein
MDGPGTTLRAKRETRIVALVQKDDSIVPAACRAKLNPKDGGGLVA